MKAPEAKRRNFGPPGGDRMILAGDALVPRPLKSAVLFLVAAVGLVLARKNIRHSRAYLETVTGRPAGILGVWKHYHRLLISLHRKLRVAAGRDNPRSKPADPAAAEEYFALARSGEPALFGTFHVGDSDLIGCLLTRNFSRRVTMIRLRMANSGDTERLARRFGEGVDIVWINRPEEMVVALNRALESGGSIALQCDREEHATRTAYFRFLGANRRFPVTIYHLAALYSRPVAIAFAFTGDDGVTVVHTPPLFRPAPGASRAEVVEAGKAHFQVTLDLLEKLLREDPYLWFNFLPLNSVEPEAKP